MILDDNRKKYIETIFAPLNSPAAVKSFPPVGSLSKALSPLITGKDKQVVDLPPKVACLFGTGAVDAWMRSVHSFLVSASLTQASPIWASVAGYYSSHYAVRGIAHLLGLFLLHNRKRVAMLDLDSGKHRCSFNPKDAGDREHSVYWKLVKRDKHFINDILFTENLSDRDRSDVGHRDKANYSDHIGKYPVFHALAKDVQKSNVQKIAELELSDHPIPDKSKYPDVISVQIIAYHRLVRFREMLDEALGSKNKFWNYHRKPEWTENMITFQIAEVRGLASIG